MKGIEQTKHWFEIAVPQPEEQNKLAQIGCNMEEVAELTSALVPEKDLHKQALFHMTTAMNAIAEGFKSGELKIDWSKTDRKEVLDALADQIVTAVGIAHMLNMDIAGALDEVNASNFSKFVDGKPVFNENKKIMKGPDYFKPDLSKFV